MKRKMISLILILATTCSLVGCGNSEKSEGTEKQSDDVTISLLNTKPEIQVQIEEMAKKYEEKTGVVIETYSSTSGSEEVSKRYAAGNPPTMMMLDSVDARVIGPERGLDLSGEKWVEDAKGKATVVDGTVYGFPVCVEGRGLVYNKEAIKDITGREFDPSEITCLSDFEKLLEELVKGGMETPVALAQENWALAGHFFGNLVEDQDGTEAGAQKFIDAVAAGDEKLMSNRRFNSYMDLFDVLKKYNINKDDPLSADYAQNTMYLAEGEVAFTVNGNWLWPDIMQYTDSKEFGLMSMPQDPAEDEMNQKLNCLYSKQIIIDKEEASEEQIKAAKDFLNWLVYDEEGINFVVSDCQMISPFSSDTSGMDPLGQSVLKYVEEDKLVEPYYGMKSDFIVVMGASMQKYLGGEIDRQGLASEAEEYFSTY